MLLSVCVGVFGWIENSSGNYSNHSQPRQYFKTFLNTSVLIYFANISNMCESLKITSNPYTCVNTHTHKQKKKISEEIDKHRVIYSSDLFILCVNKPRVSVIAFARLDVDLVRTLMNDVFRN